MVDVLRRSPLTVNELAAKLEVTHNAVRSHLAALQREGLVRQAGLRRGGTRPAVVYALVPRAESVLSSAYIPFVAQLLAVLGEQMSGAELDALMQTVGRRLAAQWPRLQGDLPRRIGAAALLLEELGAQTELERIDGTIVLRGFGCLLGEAVHGRPQVCLAVESLLANLIEAPVRQCCELGEHPRCCFEIGAGPQRPRQTRRARTRPPSTGTRAEPPSRRAGE